MKNSLTQRYHLYEGGRLIHVDIIPGWLLSESYLREIVEKVNLKYFDLLEGHVVVDVGAGTGTEAVIYSSMVGTSGQVHAIESHPETFKSLYTLASEGGYSNIHSHQWAVGNKNSTVWIQNDMAHQKNALMQFSDTMNDAISIEMRTLDQFVIDHKIERIDFLKVNIEGAELQMLEGMKDCVHIIQAAAISCHDFIDSESSFPIMEAVRIFFERNGFQVHHCSDDHPALNSWLYMIRKGR
jgi:FkbM family methyltransferase